MSLATWKAEFYPTGASQCPEEQAIEHSLVKWRGLRDEALERHGVKHEPTYTRIEFGTDRFGINDMTCALCEHHATNGCRYCPLAISRGGVPCDSLAEGEEHSPYVAWRDGDDPEPMIAALEKALADKNGSQA